MRMFHVKRWVERGCDRLMHVRSADWIFRQSLGTDAEWMADLRALVLRADLERLGRYDEQRVRERFLAAFSPQNTRVIVRDKRNVGLVAVRSDGEVRWIEHFYLEPTMQGMGIGGQVLGEILADSPDSAHRLNVLQGSAARRLYARHGFEVEREDAVDVFMIRTASSRRS